MFFEQAQIDSHPGAYSGYCTGGGARYCNYIMIIITKTDMKNVCKFDRLVNIDQQKMLWIVFAKYLKILIIKYKVAQLTTNPQYILLRIRNFNSYLSPSILIISVHLYISIFIYFYIKKIVDSWLDKIILH